MVEIASEMAVEVKQSFQFVAFFRFEAAGLATPSSFNCKTRYLIVNNAALVRPFPSIDKQVHR